MRTDEALQQDVQNVLKWQPQLSIAEIGVAVEGGIVTLTGTVDHYGKRKPLNMLLPG
jgi:osmotically-inducible protein OsmY